jgi:hypothetical protein
MLVVNTSCGRQNRSKPSCDTVLVYLAVSCIFYTRYIKRTLGMSCSFCPHFSFPKRVADFDEIWYVGGVGYIQIDL